MIVGLPASPEDTTRAPSACPDYRV